MVDLSLLFDDALHTNLTGVDQWLDLLDVQQNKILFLFRNVQRLHLYLVELGAQLLTNFYNVTSPSENVKRRSFIDGIDKVVD